MGVDEFDYIIVGAGSAGCVIANRLSENGRLRVLVLEAGGSDRQLMIKLPIGYGRTFFDERINWKFETEPDPGCNDRVGYWPRGKVIGGSSSINALVYCRGLPQDFEDWKSNGAAGWGWNDVRPHFESIECQVGRDGRSTGDGALYVTDVTHRAHIANRHFFNAAREIGLNATDDFNGPNPEGVGYYRITTKNGMRCSAADAFLRPALSRGNIKLITGAVVEKVTFEGRKATGVVYRRDGQTATVRARHEVVLSAGAIKSPQILQLSGIGPGNVLSASGVDTLLDNPNVGGNLQDHLGINYFYKATEPTLNNELSPWWGKLFAGMKYVLGRTGPLSLSVNQCGGFVRSSPDVRKPDIQLYFNPLSYTTAPEDKRPLVNPDPFPGFTICFQPTRPTSRGRVDIQSPDFGAPPKIDTNYLSTDKDIDDVIAGGHLIQSLVRTSGLQKLIAGPVDRDMATFSDDDIIQDFRQRCGTVFHPASTCRMGQNKIGSVVDPDLKVHGVENLRVIDASIFPCVTSGNINAPTMMLANKAADVILKNIR